MIGGEPQLVRVGDLELACQRYGDDSAPAIVLIRGLGTQMIEWSPVLVESFVSGGLGVVVFDNRDAGLSSKLTTAYSLGAMAGDVLGLLDALAVERAHVLGISLGGMVAQLVAHAAPNRVRSLISIMSSSGAPGLPTASPELREAMLKRGETAEEIIAIDAANRALFGSPGYPESKALREALARRAHERCYCPEGVARQLEAAMSDGSRAERLGELRLPALVIHGADDVLLPPACGEDTAARIPGAELEIVPGMGHNIPDALAPKLAARVLDFMASRAPA
jgi:proline iminopeptidase